eukprot:Lankesteria_metandrocarpae@DN3255_c0_g1_i2.p1
MSHKWAAPVSTRPIIDQWQVQRELDLQLIEATPRGFGDNASVAGTELLLPHKHMPPIFNSHTQLCHGGIHELHIKAAPQVALSSDKKSKLAYEDHNRSKLPPRMIPVRQSSTGSVGQQTHDDLGSTGTPGIATDDQWVAGSRGWSNGTGVQQTASASNRVSSTVRVEEVVVRRRSPAVIAANEELENEGQHYVNGSTTNNSLKSTQSPAMSASAHRRPPLHSSSHTGVLSAAADADAGGRAASFGTRVAMLRHQAQQSCGSSIDAPNNCRTPTTATNTTSNCRTPTTAANTTAGMGDDDTTATSTTSNCRTLTTATSTTTAASTTSASIRTGSKEDCTEVDAASRQTVHVGGSVDKNCCGYVNREHSSTGDRQNSKNDLRGTVPLPKKCTGMDKIAEVAHNVNPIKRRSISATPPVSRLITDTHNRGNDNHTGGDTGTHQQHKSVAVLKREDVTAKPVNGHMHPLQGCVVETSMDVQSKLDGLQRQMNAVQAAVSFLQSSFANVVLPTVAVNSYLTNLLRSSDVDSIKQPPRSQPLCPAVELSAQQLSLDAAVRDCVDSLQSTQQLFTSQKVTGDLIQTLKDNNSINCRKQPPPVHTATSKPENSVCADNNTSSATVPVKQVDRCTEKVRIKEPRNKSNSISRSRSMNALDKNGNPNFVETSGVKELLSISPMSTGRSQRIAGTTLDEAPVCQQEHIKRDISRKSDDVDTLNLKINNINMKHKIHNPKSIKHSESSASTRIATTPSSPVSLPVSPPVSPPVSRPVSPPVSPPLSASVSMSSVVPLGDHSDDNSLTNLKDVPKHSNTRIIDNTGVAGRIGFKKVGVADHASRPVWRT